MKLVSTSNFELERAGISPRTKTPLLEANSDGIAAEFTRSMLKLTAAPLLGHDQEFRSKQESECDPDAEALTPDAEALTPNVEALAAAPANDSNLIEGFALFGSIFSLPDLKQHSEGECEGKPTSVLDFNERSVSIKLSKESAVASIVANETLNSVVIDFGKASKKTSALSELDKKSIGQPQSAASQPAGMPLSEPDLLGKLRLRDQTEAVGTAVITPRPKDESLQSSVDALTLDQPVNSVTQSAVSVSDTQPPIPNPPRVDQIVRAVLQQSAEISGSHVLAAERQSHAGLTGQTLRLSLHPAELGSVQISVSKRGSRLQVTIIPDQESTGRLLLMDVDQLAKSLGVASNNADYVQIHVATPDRSFEMQPGGDPKQGSMRSEYNRNGQDGQHTASHTSKPSQQGRENSDEKRTVSRAGNSDHRSGGAVYI